MLFIRILFFICFFFISNSSFSYLFQFKDKPGDEYFLRTFSVQEVLINNVYRGIFDLKYEGRLKVLSQGDLGAKLSGKYLYYNKPYFSTKSYKLENRLHTKSQFIRQKNGHMIVPKHVFFPVVRHVPTFLDKDVKIGDTWVKEGEEAQDLRKLGIKKPFILPIQVRYRYLRDEVFRGKQCAVLEVFYILNYNSTKAIGKSPLFVPARVMGFFKGTYYWNKQGAYPLYYEANYDFIYILMNGEVREFRGVEYGDVKKLLPDIVEVRPEDEKPDIDKDIEKQLEESELNFPIKREKNKITINLGEVLFDFNSAELKKSSVSQLNKLAKLLMKYDNYDLDVEGHTDSIGSDKANMTFSEMRAKNVRDYLVQKGVSADKTNYKGYGKNRPIESNNTKSGRAKNRRVEIIIFLKKKSDT